MMYYVFRVKKSMPVCVHACTDARLTGGILLDELELLWKDPDADASRLTITRDKSMLTVLHKHKNGPLYNRCLILVGPNHLLPEEAVKPALEWHARLTSPKPRILALHQDIFRLQQEINLRMADLLKAMGCEKKD
jgi:hypothetical protein